MLVKEDVKQLPVVNKTVGVDVGIKDLAICSDGTKFNNPRLTNKYAKKLANCRKDFTHKMTTTLINENQVIGIESLKVKNMVKNRKLSKHIHDANFGEIVRQLEYKADWYGREARWRP
ncbi:putative transposase [Moritella sp. JT01]|uniref:transposase n=1 Tax=Moritella sp. JT01 TaxID=756698 RepID=UPI000793A0C3|nr:transposase [Moritella sp. JT01]KXO08545.1 putative transposase [Moritella sp. JT01]